MRKIQSNELAMLNGGQDSTICGIGAGIATGSALTGNAPGTLLGVMIMAAYCTSAT